MAGWQPSVRGGPCSRAHGRATTKSSDSSHERHPWRSAVALLALVARVCSASGAVVGDAQAPARQPSVTTDVGYGHKDGLALTLDVHVPARPNGAGVISIVRGGWQSS